MEVDTPRLLVHTTPARDKRATNVPSHSATGHHHDSHADRCTQVASLGPTPPGRVRVSPLAVPGILVWNGALFTQN